MPDADAEADGAFSFENPSRDVILEGDES